MKNIFKVSKKIKWTDYPIIDVSQINLDLHNPDNELLKDIMAICSITYSDLQSITNCETEFYRLINDYNISFKDSQVDINPYNISIRFIKDFKGEFENTLVDYLNRYFKKDVEFCEFINECYDQLYYLIDIYGIQKNDDFTNRLVNIAINTIQYSCNSPHVF